MIQILLLEDEKPAFEKLQSYLNDYYQNEVNIFHSDSIQGGKVLLKERDYDLILSDIQLLDGISFDLFTEVRIQCPIIFCTAFNEYVFHAFQTNGIAYIVKPYTKIELAKALKKFEDLFGKGKKEMVDTETLKEVKQSLRRDSTNFKTRFVIKKSNGIHLLETAAISYIKAEGDFCKVYDKEGQLHLLSQSLSAVEKSLNPKEFFRVNRSAIVGIDSIDKMDHHSKGRLLIKIKNSKEIMNTSANTTTAFKKWLEN